MPDSTVKVVRLAEVNGANSQGQAERQIQVSYTVGSHGPFTRNYPQQGFDAIKVTSDLQEFARQVANLPHGQ